MASKRTIILDGKEVAIRSYEVSIWTLQDSFITVLKWANLENKGQIQQPKVILDTDGTESFSFSIPMYLHPGEENPIWYNTLNGNLMIGMRKIKVILNKTLDEEKVFEFLITKVKERHEKDQLYCDVECEGLAFHELGKIGYKIALSQDDFLTRYEQWYKEDGNENTEPHQTINYWNEQFLELEKATTNQTPNKWYYKVEMNWDSYGSNLNRDSDKIYEDEYVASWKESNNKLVPSRVEGAREKERPVEISESNIYNITQKIAESFGVFCRYEYGYDTNYHIISRTIIYYNNFIEEEKGHMDLTYPYHTSEITREMDSTELTTKLFVRPVDYEYSETGETTIMSVDANKSREDYILNFEYLHKFNIITDEQYSAIEDYEKQMHFINLMIENLSKRINYLQNKKIDLEAQSTIIQNGSEEAEKQINDAADNFTVLLNNETGTIVVEGANAKVIIIKQDTDNGQYYITMPFVGIIPETIKLYKTIGYDNGGVQLSNEVEETGTVVLDDMTGDISKIVWPTALTSEEIEINTLWMTCQYVPNTYWTKVKQYWEQAKVNIDNKKKNIDKQLVTVNSSLVRQLAEQQTLLDQQKSLRKEFEIMMGPALREGYWQPEDYKDYGDKYTANFNSNNQTIDLATYKFDTDQYDNDDKLTYYEGQDEKTYLVAILDDSSLSYIQANYDNLSFIYHDKAIIQLNASIENPSESQALAYIRDTKKSIRVGAGCRFGFVEYDHVIKPALIIENISSFTDDQINFLMGVEGNASLLESNPMQLGILDIDIKEVTENNNTITKITSTVRNGAIQLSPLINSGISAVYPRIIIDSLLLKHTTEKDLLIKFGNDLLEEYKDYSVLIESYADDNNNVWKDQYFINLKPEAYFKKGTISPDISISYSLSNANTMIYLDALEVSKENSQPKVAYTIKLSMYDPYIIHDIYNKMSKIVHINDNQLKFENVQGYISHIEMMLDTPWEDSIEVKNYKTKFEDLFSNIVAQTSAMEKKSFSYDIAAAAFNSDGSLTSTTVNKMLDSNSLIFKTYIDDCLIENETLRNMLTNIFDEAGQVLSSAGNALADIKALTSSNASILSGFVRGAEEGFARGIDLISSDSTYTSAVQINRDGIFIGSDQRIALYSGIIGNESNGVSIDLNPSRLILGASSASNATAAKFTDKYLVLAAGDIIASSEDNTINLDTLTVNGTINGLVGAKFTSNSFGLATLSENTLNTILMNDKGITIGSSNIDRNNNQIGQNLDQDTATLRATNGSYVRIAGTGIDIGSGANLYAYTNNLIIDSEATGSDSIFELKRINNNITETALKCSNAGLEIKGAITATSFQLMINGTATNLLDNNGQISSSLIDTSGYAINGLTTIGWGEETTNKPQYVALSSTNGLLLGAQKEIVIPRFTPVQLDNNTSNDTADSTNVIVKISNDGIYFNYYENNNDTNPTNQISMDNNGIKMTDPAGELKPIWSQDNIVIMNNYDSSHPNWNQKQEWVEYAMRTKSNWVLIKPYYDATIRYIPVNDSSLHSQFQHLLMQENGGQAEFGTGDYFIYQLQFNGVLDTSENISQNVSYTCKIIDTYYSNNAVAVNFTRVNINTGSLMYGSTAAYDQTVTLTGSSAINLCQSGHQLAVLVETDNTSGKSVRLLNIQLICSTDATTARVPCTTYYYPTIQTFDYTPTGYGSKWPNYDSNLPYPVEEQEEEENE